MLAGICCNGIELTCGFVISSADVSFFIGPCLGKEDNELELILFSPKLFATDAMKQD